MTKESLITDEARAMIGVDKPIADMLGFMQANQFESGLRDAAYQVTRGFGRCTTLRCACQEYRLLALGAVDFVIHARPTAWDPGLTCRASVHPRLSPPAT